MVAGKENYYGQEKWSLSNGKDKLMITDIMYSFSSSSTWRSAHRHKATPFPGVAMPEDAYAWNSKVRWDQPSSDNSQYPLDVPLDISLNAGYSDGSVVRSIADDWVGMVQSSGQYIQYIPK